MYVSAAVLGLAGAAAAAVAAVAPIVPKYPETWARDGFRLVINVTDASGDKFSIQNTYVYSIRGHSGERVLAQVKDVQKGYIFYLYGTQTDHFNNNKVVTQSFVDSPWALKLVSDNEKDPLAPQTARLDLPDKADAYFNLFYNTDPIPVLYPENWIVCQETFPIYDQKDQKYFIIKQAANFWDSTYGFKLKVPENCIIVKLLPECAKLKAQPKVSATGEHLVQAHCYPDVKEIDWSKYTSG